MDKTPITKTGDYKKMLMEVHKTYHKDEVKQEKKRALSKELLKWLFGN